MSHCRIATPNHCPNPATCVLVLKQNSDGSGADFVACCESHAKLCTYWAAIDHLEPIDNFQVNADGELERLNSGLPRR